MTDDCKTKIALLEQAVEGLSTRLQALDDRVKESVKDTNSLIRKVLLGLSLSFFATLAYLAKNVLDKVG